jgi:hypothetical protein
MHAQKYKTVGGGSASQIIPGKNQHSELFFTFIASFQFIGLIPIRVDELGINSNLRGSVLATANDAWL